jgi:signal transduction histidine kinase
VRSAFSTGSLEAVSMIAGQLAVSLENALIHDRLEQRVLDQTRELVASARRSGMAQIATNVLHNVGNVLNSVNVSARLLASRIRESRAQRVTDLARLLDGSGDGELARSLAASEQGRVLPGYVRSLATELGAEREELVQELERLVLSVDHIKNVVAMQLSYAGASGVLELCSITDLVEDALLLHESAFAREGICVVKDYVKTGETALDKTRLMQILVNLFENATQAMAGTQGERVLTIGVRADEAAISLRVSDKGSGIATQDLDKIFAHGFTTKSGGHGFGLHSCVVAAREMGGSLTAQSKGPGQGATFVLTLPMVASGQAGPA